MVILFTICLYGGGFLWNGFVTICYKRYKNELSCFDGTAKAIQWIFTPICVTHDYFLECCATRSVIKSFSVPVLFWGFVFSVLSALSEMHLSVVQVLDFTIIPLCCFRCCGMFWVMNASFFSPHFPLFTFLVQYNLGLISVRLFRTSVYFVVIWIEERVHVLLNSWRCCFVIEHKENMQKVTQGQDQIGYAGCANNVSNKLMTTKRQKKGKKRISKSSLRMFAPPPKKSLILSGYVCGGF